ncbi:hypothetical protein RND71_021764 [Anisodus tanguticus]|uniref:TATA-box binding protein n=1 Tax=Anisodus tanguticus TaxID=243964 RepID=A0AAE1RXL8_9SOLA|nr:hypothetical protein RND71_021764 [Anisodus tanguticus]
MHLSFLFTARNIVSTVNLDCKFDLEAIALQARNAEYNPKRFRAVIMRIREPKTTALIFTSGKMVYTGAKSERSKMAARKIKTWEEGLPSYRELRYGGDAVTGGDRWKRPESARHKLQRNLSSATLLYLEGKMREKGSCGVSPNFIVKQVAFHAFPSL